DAERVAALEVGQRRLGRKRDHDEIDDFRDILDLLVGGQALDGLVLRIDRVEPLESRALEQVDGDAADPLGVIRGADDGYRARPQERVQAHAGTLTVLMSYSSGSNTAV